MADPKDRRDQGTKHGDGQSWTAQMLKKHGKSPHIRSTGKG
jgi:hypothetical protein